MSKRFTSYYNSFGQNGKSAGFQSHVHGDHGDLAEEQPEIKILPPLFPGEEIIARAQGVHVFQPLSSKNQGLSGELYVSNFKLSFQTLHFPDDRRAHFLAVKEYWHPWMSGLIDIPLASISALCRLSKSGRRKPFKIGPLKRLLVVCKNFRLETFSFEMSTSSESHGVASALAGYVFPSEKERLFVYSYVVKAPVSGNQANPKQKTVDFSNRSDWTAELTRCQANTREVETWRVTQANERFHLCVNLPKCFVIPASIGDDAKLEDLSRQLNASDEQRPLIWCWSFSNGAALCRMSNDVDDTFVKAVQNASPTKKSPKVLDVGLLCPSVKDVRKECDSWRNALLAESASILEAADDKWFLDIENSKWIQGVSRCLEVTKMAVDAIQQRHSVVLKESGDRDLNCLVSCLVQLCMDSTCRTQKGFQRLVEKDFVALGHRFQDRLGLVKTDPDRESPVFLFFLDCVFQLTLQYPDAFEFSDVYLVLLWDSAILGAYKTFSMNCQRDIISPATCSSSIPNFDSRQLPAVWQLDLSSKTHLLNPLYSSSALLDQLCSTFPPNLTHGLPRPAILLPRFSVPFLQVWKNCYFRFIPPMAVDPWVRSKLETICGVCDRLETVFAEVARLNGDSSPHTTRYAEIGGRNGQINGAGNGDVRDGRGDAEGSPVLNSQIMRRRSQLVRPFTPNSSSNHSLMTFQK